MAPSKRKIETIDLTNDSDVGNDHPRKVSKSKHQDYPTPPTSSQSLKSSQPHTGGDINHSSSQGQSSSQPQRDVWSATQERSLDEDIRREIDLSQDDDEDAYENRQLYGILNTKIVGIRYYNGHASVGEYVTIRREPRNQYDANAIRVDNVMRQQIGHIPRTMAAKLAQFIDSGDLLLEGSLTGTKGEFDCPIALKMFGTNDAQKAQDLKTRMKNVKLPVQELDKAEKERKKREAELEKQRKAREKAAEKMKKQGNIVIDNTGPNKYSNFNTEGDGSNTMEDLGSILSDTTIFNPREVQDAVNRFAHTEETLSKLPMADQPEQLATKLLPYQRQGLQWMLEHENPSPPKKDDDPPVQFWKKNRGFYTNIATGFSVKNVPDFASGGILADDMGLGKTIQILSLIATDPKKTGKPTLIIAPLSVMSNWKKQAETHMKKKYAPKILVYHGSEKTDKSGKMRSAQDLQSYDIIITTYQTMTLELFTSNKDEPAKVPTRSGLFSFKWRRVVLDEGHNIRNPKAKMSRAAHTLQADSRWVLTGTPIVNNLKDLYSHVKFIQLPGGLSEFEIFNANVIRPVKNGDPNGQNLLRALMQTLCLRRMKDMKFVDLRLPDLTFHNYPVKFLPHEQERYDAFKAEAKGLVEAAKAKKGDNTMTYLLEVLLRLRQTCNHWKMCGEERVSKLLSLLESEGGVIVDTFNPANRKALQDLLQLKLDNQEDCPICMEALTDQDRDPVITACTHAFCRDCIVRAISTQHKCPMCRAELPNPEHLVTPAANFGEASQDQQSASGTNIDPDQSSSKIEAVVKLLAATARDTPDVKTVVFSQWTSFLDILEPHLRDHNLQFARLDGRISPLKRDVAIESLSTDPKCGILLASLSACSVGINLTAASQVVLCDSWWAPAVEDQAVDRVYRLGQERECRVVRFVMAGSVEEEVLEIQKRKRRLVGVAFGDDGGRRGRGRAQDREERLGEIERLLR